MMRSILLWGTLCASLSFGQGNYAPAQPDQAEIKKQERLNAARNDLEALRGKRDSIVALRWKEKQTQVDGASSTDDKWQDIQGALDRELAKQQQLSEELRGLRAETQGLQQQSEAARQKFAQLSDMNNRFDELRSNQKGVPENPESIARLNQVREQIESLRDQPARAFNSLVQHGLGEAARGEVIQFGPKESMGGLGSLLPVDGYELRMGQAFAVRMDKNFQHASMLLPHADRSNSVLQWTEVKDTLLLKQIADAFRGLSKADSGTALVPLDILLSPKTAQAQKMAAEPAKGFAKFVKQIQEADLFAYLILLLGLAGVLLAAERMWVWARHRHFKKQDLLSFFDLIERDQLPAAEQFAAQKFRGIWRRLAVDIMQAKEAGHNRAEVEQMVEEAFLRDIPKLEQRVYTISVLSAVAPLMGLLGTVFGMIQLFEAISSETGDNAKRMAEGISIALVATELGLAVAIPVQLLHNFVSNRIDGLIAQIQANTLKLVNALWHRS